MSDGSTHSDGGTDGARTRRSVLRAAGGVGAALATAGTASAGEFGDDDGDGVPENFPVITTRDHFDDSADLTGGNTATNYGTAGDWTGYDDRAPGDSELLVAVHGWNVETPDGRDMADTTRRALRANGYDQLVVGYTWDADKGWGFDLGWSDAVDIARQNGPKLAQWLADHRDAGGRPVRLLAHSLGARVVVEALGDLQRRGRADAVRSVSLVGGAIDDQEVETDEPYGTAIENATRRLDNYYKTDDAVLDWAYGAVEFETAVGEEGIQDAGDAPDNYTEVDVTDAVAGHGVYYEPDDGCIPTVVANF